MRIVSYNIGIKINNNNSIIQFLKDSRADFIALQESVRSIESTAYPQFRSYDIISSGLSDSHVHTIFGPLWYGSYSEKNGEKYLDFGGRIEQGNSILSRIQSIGNENLFYQGEYGRFEDTTYFRRDDHPRALLIAEYMIDNQPLQILNIHGIWNATRLGDERTFNQCEYIVKKALEKDIATIIVGDFNLLPESEGIQYMNQYFHNITLESGIHRTRPIFDYGLDTGNVVVDYIFVNEKVKVKNITVQEINISDHYPLILDFTLI